MIEIRFQFPDPRRRLAAVRLAHELRDRLPYELTLRGTAWELTARAPDVARFEYQFELIDRRGLAVGLRRSVGEAGLAAVADTPQIRPEQKSPNT